MRQKCRYSPAIMKNNTKIVNFTCYGKRGNSVYFIEGCQSFEIASQLNKTAATWYRKMLAIALTNFAEDKIKSSHIKS